ncbi:MAG: endonuclease V [Thermoprotei archaeon]
MVERHTLKFLERFQYLISKNVRQSHLGIENVRSVCALDVAYKGDTGIAVAVIEREGKLDVRKFVGKVEFPYVPGFLFMREAPLMLEALGDAECDLILVDGHGIAHPRKSGIATVIGVLLERPSIGVAKSKLAGEVVNEGGIDYVLIDGEKRGVRFGKYYYSPGNLTDLQDCIDLAKRGYPYVLRLADRISKEEKKRV